LDGEEHGQMRLEATCRPAYGCAMNWRRPALLLTLFVSLAVSPVRAADPTQIKQWETAAAKGDAEALNQLGRAHTFGQGVPKDLDKAYQFLRRAADQGHAEAQNAVGVFHYNGMGSAKKDPAEAARWYRKGAEQGLAKAQNNLGLMLVAGDGVKQDEAEAAKWFRAAAEQGFANGQYNLGMSLRDGHGVEKDPVQAHQWLALAARQNFPGSADSLKELEARMKPEEITEAKKRAAAFVPKPSAK
jgi:hypothetical protein